jgi:hypothetical protein
MKMVGAMPQVGQAAVSNPPHKEASKILRIRSPLVDVELVETLLLLLCLFMMFFFRIIGQRYDFLVVTISMFLFFSEKTLYIKKTTIFAQIFCRMKKVYKVAGHRFAVVMPDEEGAWNEMQKYETFLTEDLGDYLYTAELINEMPDTTGKQLVVVSNQGADLPRVEVYDWNGKWLFEIAPMMEAPVRVFFFADKDFTTMHFRLLGTRRFSMDIVMQLMFAFATARKNTLMMHASVTMHDGKGYLFLGKSGTGKSTHSQLWINNIEGCELLNDDHPALRVENNGEVRVYGTPWSGKTPCYRNVDVPVGAIVDLHQAKKNEIKRLSLPEAYAAIFVSFSGLRFIKEQADGLHTTNALIVGSVPCFRLDCLPDAEAAWLCYNTVSQ